MPGNSGRLTELILQSVDQIDEVRGDFLFVYFWIISDN